MDQSTLVIIGAFLGMIVALWRIASWYQSKVDQAVSKVFEAFDRHKENVDKKLFWLQDINNNSFVRKDNCALQVDFFKTIYGDIKKDIEGVSQKIDTYMLNGKKTDGG